MHDASMKINAGLRFWSDSYSLKAVAARFAGRVAYLHEIGEPILLPSGEISARTATRHYLALREREAHEPAAVPALIAQCLNDIRQDAYVAAHVSNTPLETVLHIAVFGMDRIGFDALGIEPEPFGEKIGLVVENYTVLTEDGLPEKWLIEAIGGHNAQNLGA